MLQSVGKRVLQALYFHHSVASALSPEIQDKLRQAEELTQASPERDYNVVKINEDGATLSLLHYPDFFNTAFPVLMTSWRVDLIQQTVRRRSYQSSLNPPILHRKELLLLSDHPRYAEYAALSKAAEELGLFANPTRIGFKQAWDRLIIEAGYQVSGHQLLPLGNDETETEIPAGVGAETTIARHRTALARYNLSAPVQCLVRYGFLDGEWTFFDYGCGRGDDVSNLLANGLQANGWDPHYAPQQPLLVADIVNLGFVINVIEDYAERTEALQGAYALANRLLVVSAMLVNQNALKGQSFNDGILTQRNTFQKYYTQSELRQFIAETLQEEPLPVGPGIFFVFKDKGGEQHFLLNRQRSRANILRLTQRVDREATAPRQDKNAERYAQYRHLLEPLWAQWLQFGREPEKAEAENLPEVLQAFGSLNKALRFLASQKETNVLAEARKSRIEDLSVYFALRLFEKRPPYRHLDAGLKIDIKAFLGDYSAAQAVGKELLFGIADTAAIEHACREAAERGLGWLDEGEALQMHTSFVEELPPLLRVYIGCATLLYGDITQADLIKIHIRTGKLTLLKFDNFIGKPLPSLLERVKIKLRAQDFDLFQYGQEFTPPYLYLKSRYINEEFPCYAEQLAFDEALQSLQLFDLSRYGPAPQQFNEALARARWQIEGFQLQRSQTIPGLDEPCGQYLTYRQLIECGETQEKTGLLNRPQQPDSYTALYDLACHILDPVIEYFGMIRLTYGFCSPELARHIPGRIAPKLDQHAAHEVNRSGQPVCSRLGAAVDFLVEDEDMQEVAAWIAANTPFDRLYFYGADKPIHVSYGPENKREVVEMLERSNGRRVPRIRKLI